MNFINNKYYSSYLLLGGNIVRFDSFNQFDFLFKWYFLFLFYNNEKKFIKKIIKLFNNFSLFKEMNNLKIIPIPLKISSSYIYYKYITKKLKEFKSITRIVRFLIDEIFKDSSIYGFKIKCTGRFTRKERATYMWEKKGKIPLSSISTYIDYFNGVYQSRFGSCGLKIWSYQKI